MCKRTSLVRLPPWLRPDRSDRIISVDSCIRVVIQDLWKEKIVTLGCCCGHGRKYQSVVIGDNENINEVVKVLSNLDPSNNWIINQWQLNSFILSEIAGETMSWKPSEKDQKFIELLVSMCADTLIRSGVINKATFISDLKIICKLMEVQNEKPT